MLVSNVDLVGPAALLELRGLILASLVGIDRDPRKALLSSSLSYRLHTAFILTFWLPYAVRARPMASRVQERLDSHQPILRIYLPKKSTK